MGANKKPFVADSVGETLAQKHGVSPQVMSYVLPLLIEEEYCTLTQWAYSQTEAAGGLTWFRADELVPLAEWRGLF